MFTPKHPKTRPSLSEIERIETALDVDGLMQEAVEGVEMVHIRASRG